MVSDAMGLCVRARIYFDCGLNLRGFKDRYGGSMGMDELGHFGNSSAFLLSICWILTCCLGQRPGKKVRGQVGGQETSELLKSHLKYFQICHVV